MKKVLCLALVFAMAVSFSFAGGATQADTVSGATPNSPKGKIVIYTSMYEDIIEGLRWLMKRQFPNCAIEFVYGGTGEIQSKIAAEEAAKKLGCDILLVADPSFSMELKAKNILHPYKPSSIATLAFDYDPEGYWYPVRVSNMVLAFNPTLTPRDSLPSTFYDFANDPNLRGTISMSNPLVSGTTMVALSALRDKYGDGFLDALASQNVRIENGAVALARLESGEEKMVMVLEEAVLQKQQEEVSSLEIIYPEDGTIMIPSTIMTIADEWSANRNIRTAEIITEWFLSPEGQNFIVDSWMHSVRKNFRRIPYGAKPTPHIQSNVMPINWENCLNQRDEIETIIENYIISR